MRPNRQNDCGVHKITDGGGCVELAQAAESSPRTRAVAQHNILLYKMAKDFGITGKLYLHV